WGSTPGKLRSTCSSTISTSARSSASDKSAFIFALARVKCTTIVHQNGKVGGPGGDCRLPAMPPPGQIPRRGCADKGQTIPGLGLLGTAGSQLRTDECAVAGYWPRSRGAWRKPDWTGLYRRPVR